MLRHPLAGTLAFLATAIVFACSSSSTPTGGGTSSSGGSSSGSTGDDDDGGSTTPKKDGGSVVDAGCRGSAILDCDHLLQRAESANCTGFDDKAKTTFKAECEDKNCQTPSSCSTELETLGECIGDQPGTCNDDGTFNGDTPAACTDDEAALVKCTTGG